jgi:imidazolonepropionase
MAEPDAGAATLFTNVRQLYTGESADAAALLADAALIAAEGRIVAVGWAAEVAAHPLARAAERVDCRGGVLTPGFVDSHTHAVFGAWRAWEYPLRARGTPYMEIARQGGGIHASVRDTRGRTEAELADLLERRLADVLRLGTTTVEIKSGYGLDLETELRQLRAVRRVAGRVPLDIVATFLGAHEVPIELRDRPDDYVRAVTGEMIPAVAAERLAEYCDVFMEPGVFTGAQARRILEAGARHGLVPRLHADELENSGGAELAAELGAASADHLGQVSDAGIAALAGSGTVATLLPSTLFFLGKKAYAPARRLLDAGATVALATDFNPGSSPSPSMPLVLTIACSQMGMEPIEALHAATSGGAGSLRLADGRGTLAAGAPADLVHWDATDVNEIAYRFGAPPIVGVWKRGQRVA